MVRPCLNGRLKTETSRFARFQSKTPRFAFMSASLSANSPASSLTQTAPVSFPPPHSSNAISKTRPANLATRQRTASPTEAASLNHLQLWQTHRGKSFLLSDETGSCSFLSSRQSAPSVSCSQLAPDVHHTMARRFHLWGRDGRTASGILARKTEPHAIPAASWSGKESVPLTEPDVWTLIRGF